MPRRCAPDGDVDSRVLLHSCARGCGLHTTPNQNFSFPPAASLPACSGRCHCIYGPITMAAAAYERFKARIRGQQRSSDGLELLGQGPHSPDGNSSQRMQLSDEAQQGQALVVAPGSTAQTGGSSSNSWARGALGLFEKRCVTHGRGPVACMPGQVAPCAGPLLCAAALDLRGQRQG